MNAQEDNESVISDEFSNVISSDEESSENNKSDIFTKNMDTEVPLDESSQNEMVGSGESDFEFDFKDLAHLINKLLVNKKENVMVGGYNIYENIDSDFLIELLTNIMDIINTTQKLDPYNTTDIYENDIINIISPEIFKNCLHKLIYKIINFWYMISNRVVINYIEDAQKILSDIKSILDKSYQKISVQNINLSNVPQIIEFSPIKVELKNINKIEVITMEYEFIKELWENNIMYYINKYILLIEILFR